MNDPCFRIVNATIVTPNEVINNSEITLANGRITSVGYCRNEDMNLPVVNARSRILLPGFIDMHSDAIEKEIEPRPGSLLPIEVAVTELDRKLAAAGITTIYHSLSFSDKKIEMLRTVDMVDTIIREICRIRPHLLVNTKIHARYEITSSELLIVLEELLKENAIDLVSIMDHTPGQGQFSTMEKYRSYYGTRYKLDEDKIEMVMDNLNGISDSVRRINAEAAAKLCREKGIPLASHDDDNVDKIDFIHECGAVISEFPITLAAGEAARNKGLAVAIGSPNIVRGGSHNGNLSAEEIICAGYGTIVCSDYIPSTMLHAAFSLYNNGTADLLQIAALFSTNAAEALRLNNITGSIVEGLEADLILVDTSLAYPRIAKTFVSGREVYSACLK